MTRRAVRQNLWRPSAGIRAISIGNLGIVATLCAAGLTVAGVITDDFLLSIAGVGFGTTSISFLMASHTKNFGLFHPLLLATIPVFIGTGLRPLYLRTLSPTELRDFTFGFGPEILPTGAFLVTTTSLAAFGGYLIAERFAILEVPFDGWYRPRNYAQLVARTRIVSLLLAVVAVFGIALYIQRLGLTPSDLVERFSAKRRVDVSDGSNNRIAALAYYRYLAALSAPVLYVVLLIWKLGTANNEWSSRRLRLPIVVLVALSITVPIITSSRNDLILIAVLSFAVLSANGRSYSRALVLGLAAIVVSAFFVLGIVREVGSSSGQAAPDSAAKTMLGTHNWAGPTKVGAIAHTVPDKVDYQLGSTFGNIVFAPIPSSVWPGKPVVRPGQKFSEEIFGLDREGRSGAPPGLVGELYLNFGIVGTLLGGLCYGWTLSRLRARIFRRRFGSIEDLSWVIVVVNFALRLPGGDFVGTAITTLMMLFLTNLVAGLCGVTSQTAASPSASLSARFGT